MATSHRPADIGELVDVLGVHLAPPLLERALTHRSFAYEHGNPPTNERLEFLGDAVLSLVVTDALYHRYPDDPEGMLAKMRAAVVNGRALADVARTLGVGNHLLLGKGEQTSGGRNKSSILADAVEALIGAVYVEHGIEVATAFVHRLVDPMPFEPGPSLDWKTALQEFTAELGLGVPEYVVTEEGPDHDKTFHASVLVQGVVRGKGSGKSKKEAEQGAASSAYEALKGGIPDEGRPGSESDEPPAA